MDIDQLVTDIRGRGIVASQIDEIDEMARYLANRVRPGDCVVVMSSGAFGNLHRRLLERIGDAVMPAEPSDLEPPHRMPEEAGPAVPDLADHLSDYIVLRGVRGLAGCIGLETHGGTALLKDLSLIPERRGEGLSWLLAEAAVRAAAGRGVRSLYMFGVPETLKTGKML
ncbi:MAG: hypothetical protein GY778_05670, partial [bacterium]|nr:hypothetical protein [bacterium]